MTQIGFIDIPPDADSVWWWAAVEQKRLLLPRCDNCERCFFPPQPTCPHCGSPAWQPVESSGNGVVYSWVVIHTPLHPAFAGDVPYTILAAELDEGVRLLGRLQNVDEVAAGDAIKACFYTASARTLLGFQPKS